MTPLNSTPTRRVSAPFATAVACMLASACMPSLEVLPVQNAFEGSVKTLVGRVDPAYCDYSSVAVEYRLQGASTWTALGAPAATTGDPGYHTYQVQVAGSNAFSLNQIFEQRWTVHVPAGTGWWDGYWCGSDFDIVRTASFVVTRAFDVTGTPSPLAVPAGQTRTLTLNVQRYGSFSGPVTVTAGAPPAGLTVTPGSITVPGASGSFSVAAGLNVAPGDLVAPLVTTAASVTGTAYDARVRVTSPFTLSATPNPLEVSRGGASPLTVAIGRAAGFTGPVTLSVGGLPPGVSAASPVIATGSSAIISVSASTAAAPGPFTVLVSGTAATVTQASATATVNVGRPALAGVSPPSQEKGQPITITGQSFNATCALNTVTVGTVGVVPSSCSATTLTAVIPDGAPFGNTNVSVTSAGLASNALPFRVRRKAGAFIDVTSDVIGNISNGRVCAAGLTRIDISGSYVATYRDVSTGASIGTLSFDRDTPPFEEPGAGTDWTVSPSGFGGAGFASCTTGIAFDAFINQSGCPGMVAFRMLHLATGAALAASPYCFNWYSGIQTSRTGTQEYAFVVPKVFHSPDGTILALVVASPTGPELRIALIDQATGGAVFRTIDTSGGIGGTLAFTVTASDQVTFTKAGTVYGPYAIP